MIILERIEPVADGVLCTDYVGDIRNVLLNKPKPYRLVFDKKNDIYIIGDADKYTHAELAELIVTSGYIYDIDKNFENELPEMRDYIDSDDDDSNGEVYQKYMYTVGQMLGLIFIPVNYSYRDYEETGFYAGETKITTGIIYTKKRDYFTPNGFFSDLYNSLKRVDAIDDERKSLDIIWNNSRVYRTKSDVELAFTDSARANGYTYDEILQYLQKMPGNSLPELWEEWRKKLGNGAIYGLPLAAKKYGYKCEVVQDFIRTIAEELGYSEDKVNDIVDKVKRNW